MEPITIVPADMWQIVLAVCGSIMTLSGAAAVIANIINKAKAPNREQNERLDKLERNISDINRKFEDIEERLELGNKRFETDTRKVEALEKEMKLTNKIIIESLQALTSHAIDGNNIDQLKQAETKLNSYLIEKI